MPATNTAFSPYNLKSYSSLFHPGARSFAHVDGSIAHAAKRIARIIRHKGTARVLDVGCGSGGYLAVLREKLGNASPGLQYTGIDTAIQQISAASEEFANDSHAAFIVASVYDIPAPDRFFDAVIEERMFYLLTDPLRALKEMLRVSDDVVCFHILTADKDTICYHPIFSPINRVGGEWDLKAPIIAEAGIRQINPKLVVPSTAGTHYVAAKVKRLLPQHEALASALAESNFTTHSHDVERAEFPSVRSSEEHSAATTSCGDIYYLQPCHAHRIVLRRRFTNSV